MPDLASLCIVSEIYSRIVLASLGVIAGTPFFLIDLGGLVELAPPSCSSSSCSCSSSSSPPLIVEKSPSVIDSKDSAGRMFRNSISIS